MEDYQRVTIDSYNRTAEEFAERIANSIPEPEAEQFKKYLSAGDGREKALILDMGCGSGRDARMWIDYGCFVTGIDLSEEMIRIAKQNVPEALFRVADMTDLGFLIEDGFDGIWATASLLHLDKRDVGVALNEAYSLLRPKGVMLGSVKQGKGQGIVKDERHGGAEKFYAYYDQDEFEEYIKNANFKIMHSEVRDKKSAKWINVFCTKE